MILLRKYGNFVFRKGYIYDGFTMLQLIQHCVNLKTIMSGCPTLLKEKGIPNKLPQKTDGILTAA